MGNINKEARPMKATGYHNDHNSQAAVCASASVASHMEFTAMAMAAVLHALALLRIIIMLHR